VVNNLPGLTHGASYWISTTEAITVPLLPEAASLASGSILSAPPATYYGLAPTHTISQTIKAYVGDKAEPCGTTTTEEVTIIRMAPGARPLA
jgi:hypothetical protein